MSWGGGGIDASSASTSKEDNWIVYSSGKKAVEKVIVHPLVLLSVTDHYNRVAKDTKKRVVGILLGEVSHGECHVTNSYAVPFEEEGSIWFLDHLYHENMFIMFKKVNANEKVVGWYSTGPKIRPADLQVQELIGKYTPNPVMVIIDTNKSDEGIPVECYVAKEELKEDGTEEPKVQFAHLPSTIEAHEPEEIGVEHLLRDIKDINLSTLANEVGHKLGALKGLEKRLADVKVYLERVVEGKLPNNPAIMYNLQEVFNLAPNLNVEALVKSFASKTNDHMVALYLASLVRSIIALHNLINNKIDLRTEEVKVDDRKKELRRKDKEKQAAASAKKEEEAAKMQE